MSLYAFVSQWAPCNDMSWKGMSVFFVKALQSVQCSQKVLLWQPWKLQSKVCKDGNTVQVHDFTTSAACPEQLKIALEIVLSFVGQFSDGMLKGVVVPPLYPCDYNTVPCGH